jgi:SprT protein
MAKVQHPLEALKQYLPDGTFDEVVHYLDLYKVQLTISKNRKSILGNYKVTHGVNNHRISVNGGLNKFSFLITLLHELAHMLTYDQFGVRVLPHGKEWKLIYGQVLHRFVQKNVFPDDIKIELNKSLHNPAASSCAEDELMRVLRNYDQRPDYIKLIEEIPTGATFTIPGGRQFIKGERLRKRFKCTEIGTKKMYLFSPMFEVREMPNS